ncbi:hypothetical protein HDE76_003027 [Rhodanobacter sp. ANJX3]|jgi:hypothetical protein|uniref:hypothetical protein n=1 Tax=unclassified Rhodanobacter TaxID=2621553 RepID=UPI0015CA9B4A|nr:MULTISPECIES: hypothetical protein [unclassified Rhodanobacter]MBB5359787.1 hypothetical protein [Rhodanobacter sp. ANJX3]NYE28702.1 hypothetical protein [Rhodanobacter sp. K2T2]
MEHIEYIIVGGPQHGSISRGPRQADSPMLPAEAACDGLICRAAARRHGSQGTRYLLLHPQATGEQFLTMLAA